MKKYFKILVTAFAVFAAGHVYSLQIARATDVQLVTEPGTKIVINGGISFIGTCNWKSNGDSIYLIKNTATATEGWLDSTAAGVLDAASNTGHVFFNGTNRQSFYGATKIN